MVRKRWTQQTHVSESLVNLREKRKWQIALRRYVLEGHKSSAYAPYFGLDQKKFREWIEVQFENGLSWDNFSVKWQFDHIVPPLYFDYSDEMDLRLCWNFINIQIDKTEQTSSYKDKVDVVAAKAYFEELYRQTAYQPCQAMVEKILHIEKTQVKSNSSAVSFIQQNKDYLNAVHSLSSADFDRLNTGTDLKALLYEKEFLKKYGG